MLERPVKPHSENVFLQVDKSLFEPARVSKKRGFVRHLILSISQQLENGGLARPFAPAALRRLAEQARDEKNL
jgi:hypothetical protein